ncbi:hypothetical protein GBV73_09610 [Thermococcus sp. 101 C5]|uniref:hypothetical protein n=1 Tax=unclassified Thermococcus TaxID=2627626 RepID=UPI0005B25497|nr:MULTISPECIES: hypothetical protein [unclassified Thermococcus]MPW39913.1 hypothetical protein [Thermococcus sp. 101 C5]HIH72410.1 hypothetical protein [Thermococcaceae archaeon]
MKENEFRALMIFLLNYGNIVVELSRLLNTRFITKEDFEKPIGRALKDIFYYHNSGVYSFRDYELARLTMLVKHLQHIERYDPTLLQKFREKINTSDSDYYGFRFEVAVASSLIRKGLQFTTPDPPDFKVVYNQEEIFIECTSRHISPDKDLNIIQEIKRAVNRKSKRRYDVPRCALFIDITNLYYLAHLKNQTDQLKLIRKSIKELLEKESNFGSVLLFVYLVNKAKSRFELNYIRIDNKKIDRVLKDFLDKFYPTGKYEVFDFVIPERG